MEIVNPKVQSYAEDFTSPEDALLREVVEFTAATHSKSHMLSGHLQGKFLEMVSCMMQPRFVLEIGTFTGYSALCLAKGLAENGSLHTIELRLEDADSAAGFFKKSKLENQLHLHIGDALQIIDELDYLWDLVFIDADKVNYIHYFNRVLPKVRSGGIILADNVLFHGQVLDEEIKGKNAKAIQSFNEHVRQRTDVEKLLLPLRDGMYLIRKL
ncbi:MAG TPA: O-methyltransferase [Flavisolibacter sp.]|nr:O-methyltransferase [Flavisolibacter sp.]